MYDGSDHMSSFQNRALKVESFLKDYHVKQIEKCVIAKLEEIDDKQPPLVVAIIIKQNLLNYY